MMPQAHRQFLRPRLPAWLGGGSAGHDGEAERRRLLWDEIEALLASHDLEPSPANYAVAHGYVTGDAAVRLPVEQALHAPGGLTDETMAAISRAMPGALTPDMLAKAAERLEGRLVEVMGIVGQQAQSASAYGAALDNEAQQAAADPAGAYRRLIALTRDVVTATRAMEERLEAKRQEAEVLRGDLVSARRAADRDHLTGLPNRRVFDTRLVEDGMGDGCLALCDIDDFKRINDAHGHETGDRVLRFVAKALKQELRGRALVARYGGEEFACLFDSGDLSAARTALDGIRERLKARSLVDRTSGAPIGNLTFSAGLVPIAGQPRTALRAADGALYAAKRGGKDRVVVVD